MIKMTQSFSAWCLKFHRDIYTQLWFGHTELLTKDMYEEYIAWVKTEEGKQYLKGGGKYKERGDADDKT